MSNFKKKFGENLKALRKLKHITQEKLAELIDVHSRQISKIETGENFPSAKTIEKICYTLKISPSQLFDFYFDYDKEILLTGTDDISYYRAIRHGNVITLEDYQGKKLEREEIYISDCEKAFANIAKRQKRPLIVEYIEDNEKIKTAQYNPDGTFTVTGENDFSQEIELIIKSIKKHSKNKDYVDFVKLAVQSIEDDSSLDNLVFMINGMKMARKK